MLRFTTFLVLLLIIQGYNSTSPPVNPQNYGYSSGQFSVNDLGGASYTLPMTISPGTAGMEPGLSVSWSSQGGPGIIGEGVSLGGLSAISRSSKTKAQDNEVRGIKFDSDDPLSLDGERLVLVSGEYGADGAEYRTEQNAFQKVISYGNVNGVPEKFRVWDKAGIVMEYGFVSNARVAAQSSGDVIHWLLNKMEDTKGNYIIFNYEQDIANGDYRPISIEYTGNYNTGLAPYNTVRFIYQDRPDNIPQYVQGRKIQNNKILTAIESYHEETLVRSYHFQYELGAFSNKCLLNQIQECGADGTCLDPISFTWIDEVDLDFQSVNGLPGSWVNGENKAVFQGDWDGNGQIDLLVFDTENGFNRFILNEGDFDFNSSENLNLIPSSDLDNGLISLMDFNTDGYTDLFWYNPNTGENKIFINKWTEGASLSFEAFQNVIDPEELDPANNYAAQVMGADWNADGQTDLVIYYQNSGNTRLLVNTANGGDPVFNSLPSSLVDPSLLSDGTMMVPMDWNYDGLADLFWYDKPSGETKWLENTGDGNEVSFANLQANTITPNLIKGGDGIQFGDLNGDGVSDLVWYDMTSGETRWFIHRGDQTYYTVESGLVNSVVSPFTSLSMLDFDGDGDEDVLLYKQETGANTWIRNDGKGSFTEQPPIVNPIPANQIDGGQLLFGGFGGEGMVDVFYYNNSGENRFFENEITLTNLVRSITAGNGLETTIAYRPITDEEVYEKENTAVYPIFDFQSKFYVVCYYEVDNGMGGHNRISYRYRGAKMDLSGRGFRGFREVEMTDENSGLVSTRVFNRDFRYIGSPLVRTEKRLANGTLLEETVNKDTLFEFYGNGETPLHTQFSYTYESQTKNYETDGSLIKTTTTRSILDEFGNPQWMVIDYGNGFVDSTFNTYQYNGFTDHWILGRLTSAEVTKFTPDQPAITRKSSFEYDLESGLLIRETAEPDSSEYVKIIKEYTHDAHGNITVSSTTASDGTELTTRHTYSTYDEKGRFPLTISNELGHTVTKTYDPLLGHELSVTDPNGLTTHFLYDGFGRLCQTTGPDGNWVRQSYIKCSGDCPADAVFYLLHESSASLPSKEYYDILGREIMTESTGFNGQTILTHTEYNELGLKSRQSYPYYIGQPILWIEYQYDELGREVMVTEPGMIETTTFYDGLTTTVINPKGQSTQVVKDVLGRLIETTDAEGNTVSFTYNSSGNLIAITDPLGHATTMTYDIHGQKTSMHDPDMGTFFYTYNGFGELIRQIDPQGQEVTLEYDPLGRLIARHEPEGTTTWEYDEAAFGIGNLFRLSSSDYAYIMEFSYDSLGRVQKEKEIIENEVYETLFYYDEYGRPQSTYYPAGYSLLYLYNENFYLSEVRDAGNHELFWRADSYNAKGQLTQQTFGNNTTSYAAYNEETSQLTGLETLNEQESIQSLSFTFDLIGNLLARTDHLQNWTEQFEYDNLNRLTSSAIQGLTPQIVNYDVLGNIVYKSDVGEYYYGENGAGPHQLTRIEGNGSQDCIASSETDFEYTSFDKVSRMSRDSLRLEIDYSPSYTRKVQRFYRNDTLQKTKTHIGQSIELEVTDSLTKTLFYIRGPYGVVAVRTETTETISTHYWHKDHQGSLHTISDEEGEVVQIVSFDSWGKRRHADGSTIEDEDEEEAVFDRGYTGHEHLDWFGLVNMNGRVYDPTLGRFISPDPFVQEQGELQNLNRYSYVLNNPLSNTDPSGFFFKKIGRGFKKAFKKTTKVFSRGVSNVGRGFKQVFKGQVFKGLGNIGKGFVQAGAAGLGFVGADTFGREVFGDELWNTIVVTAASIAVGAVTMGAGAAGVAGFGQTLLSGAATGFTGSSLSTLLAGGSVTDALTAGIKGAVIGTVTAGATMGVRDVALAAAGSAKGNFAKKAAYYGIKAIGHGTVQGGASVARGGKFIHGFMAASFTVGAQSGIDGIQSGVGRLAAAATVGGTASVLGGGKFANGAISGLMVRLYNTETERRKERIALERMQRIANYSQIGFGMGSVAMCGSAPFTLGATTPGCAVAIAGYTVSATANAVFSFALMVDSFQQGDYTDVANQVFNITAAALGGAYSSLNEAALVKTIFEDGMDKSHLK